ncbi:LOW QUALITY PROTEIN: Polyprotein [Phytophthora palmivora]|uniref:Polyprotein n=1 Tax=Phytophthora palmivora TaxID=4796 RepID=A0A2P4YGB9_9STRA|nr:LOW QUALITY PROTEIN: Polyprotein [Phytophthora palmivora]
MNEGPGETLKVVAYSDVNFPADKQDRKSVKGGLVTLGGIELDMYDTGLGVAFHDGDRVTAMSVMATELFGVRELPRELGLYHK